VEGCRFLFAFKAHRLANPRTITLELIEVKVGDYLGDDIERLTD
jgi:mannose-6-phosphate isomerase-like protein (cupin superfamily)